MVLLLIVIQILEICNRSIVIMNNILHINGIRIELDHAIRKCVEFDNQIVVLIYDDAIIANNVLCFDKSGTEMWKINDILNIKRPTGNVDIIKEGDNILVVHSVLGMCFKVDIQRKELIEKAFLR